LHPDERLAVNYVLFLHKLGGQDELAAFLNWVKAMAPAVVTIRISGGSHRARVSAQRWRLLARPRGRGSGSHAHPRRRLACAPAAATAARTRACGSGSHAQLQPPARTHAHTPSAAAGPRGRGGRGSHTRSGGETGDTACSRARVSRRACAVLQTRQGVS